jgi:hypothetical protein
MRSKKPGVKRLTNSSSRSMAESAFTTIEPPFDPMKNGIFSVFRRSVILREKEKEK